MIVSLLSAALLILTVLVGLMYLQVSSLTKDVVFLAEEIDHLFDQLEEEPDYGSSTEGPIDLIRLSDGLCPAAVSRGREEGDSEVH